MAQGGRARAVDLGLQGAPEAEAEGGGRSGELGGHSLPLKRLLLITLSPNWLPRYLMLTSEKGRIYRLRRSESKVCDVCLELRTDKQH